MKNLFLKSNKKKYSIELNKEQGKNNILAARVIWIKLSKVLQATICSLSLTYSRKIGATKKENCSTYNRQTMVHDTEDGHIQSLLGLKQYACRVIFSLHATGVHTFHSSTSKMLTLAHQLTWSEVAGKQPSRDHNLGTLLRKEDKSTN